MRKYLMLLIVLFPLAVNAQYTLTSDDVEFSNGTITDYLNTTEKDIIIPSVFGEDTVFHIGNFAFADPLTHVVIPNTVSTIGMNSFSYYSSPYTVSFEENSNIISITMNSINGEFTLPTHASLNFNGYIHDGQVYQPGETLSLKQNVLFFVDVSYTLTDDDAVMNNNVLESCNYDFTYKHIVIPDVLDGQEVREIGNSVFKEKEIFKVTYPSTLIVIGESAFENNAFVSIIIPEGVTSIRKRAFGINRDNESLSLPSTLDTIGAYSFYRNDISTLNLPDNVTYIGDWAFENNYLTSVVIPSNVKRIGEKAFYGNELNSVSLNSNSNLIYIKVNAFDDNENLNSITLPTNINTNFTVYLDQYGNQYNAEDNINDFNSGYYIYNPYTLTDDDVIVNVDGIIQSCTNSFETNVLIIPDMLDGHIVKETIDLPNGSGLFFNKDLFSVDLPPQLKKIGNYTFNNNNIYLVDIPDSVVYIGEGAFAENNISQILLFESTKSGYTFTNWIDGYGKKYVLGETFSDFYSSLTAEFVTGEEILFPEFYSDKVEIVPSESIQFFDASVNVNQDATYTWDFGDGESSNDKNPVHTYTSIGTYTVALNIIQDTENEITTHTNYINVVPWYTIQDDDVTIIDGVLESCSYNYSNKNIIIPNTLDNQAVVSIGKVIESLSFDGVFEDKGIQRVQLPNTLQVLGNNEFNNNEIESLIIPNNVTLIGAYALTGNPFNKIVLPKPEKVGYTMDWTNNSYDHFNGGDTVPINDFGFYSSGQYFTYKANFSSIDYNINYYYNGEASEFSPKTYTVEDEITFSIPSRDGYNFLGWYKNPEMTDTVNVPSISQGSIGDTAFYAKWEILNYNIIYHNVGSITNHNPDTYTIEDELRLRELNSYDSANYVFKGWYIDESLTQEIDSIKYGTTGDLSLYAKWIPDGDAVFRADIFSIQSVSVTCNGKSDGKIIITSKLFDVNVAIQETSSNFTVSTDASYTLDELAPGIYHLNISVGETLRNFIVEVQSITEIKSNVMVQNNVAVFNVKGGNPPYKIQIGEKKYYTETGRLTVNHLKSGSYSAVVQDNNHCTMDVQLNFDIELLKVYPNPIDGNALQVYLPNSLMNKSYQIKVISLQGVNLLSESYTNINGQINIDIETLPKGTYLLEVKGAGFQETMHFIVI